MSRETGNGKRETSGARSRPFHEKLDVFQVSRSLVLDLYRDTSGFPAAERFGLTSQIRRAAISIPANIAEGAARRSKKEFSQFLSVARGSATELNLLLDVACQTGSLTEERFREHSETLDRIFAMTSGLMRRANIDTKGRT